MSSNQHHRVGAEPLISAEGVSNVIRQLAATCKAKADILDEAFLKRADARAVQGGAICEEAQEWRQLSTALKRIALGARELVD